MREAILLGIGTLFGCFVSFCLGCAAGWYARGRSEAELNKVLNEEIDDGTSTR